MRSLTSVLFAVAAMDCGVNFNAQDNFWKHRLGRERLILRQHAHLHYGERSQELLAPRVPPRPTGEEAQQAAIEALYRSASQPALAAVLRPGRESGPGAAQAMGYMGQLPPLASPSAPRRSGSSRGGSGCSGSVVAGHDAGRGLAASVPAGQRRRVGACTPAVPPTGVPPGRHGLGCSTPALPLGLRPPGRPPTVQPVVARAESRAGTSLTRGSASSSLWLEVQEEVAKEVAKVVRPLREELENESAARLRAEEALAKAGASVGQG